MPLPSGAKALANPVHRGDRLVGAIVVFTPSKRPPIQRTPKPEKTWSSHFTFADIVGDSPALANSVRLATRAARTEHPVLVLGESGTGKEMFAHAIHDLSVRRAGPFVAFNFGAMSEELTISEMCGHEPGAFTGATASGTKSGIFDSAQGGTLFIDELQDAGSEGAEPAAALRRDAYVRARRRHRAGSERCARHRGVEQCLMRAWPSGCGPTSYIASTRLPSVSRRCASASKISSPLPSAICARLGFAAWSIPKYGSS